MRIRMYRFGGNQYFLIGLVVFMHLASVVLCMFFYDKFLVEQHDMRGLWLVFFLIAQLALTDVLMIKDRVLSRHFMYVDADSNGLHIYFRKKKRYSIAWEDVQAYGVIGYSLPIVGNAVPPILVYFTTNAEKEQRVKKKGDLNRHRVLFEFRADAWEAVVEKIPKDIRRNLVILLREHRDQTVLRGDIVEPRE